MASRRGLGKVRHIDTNQLWLQEQVRDGEVVPIKIKNVFNVSDLMTKPHNQEAVANMMELMEHRFEDGLSVVAPQLNNIDDHSGLVPMILYDLGIHCDFV